MDSTLKEILKEERRRQERSDKERHRENKEHRHEKRENKREDRHHRSEKDRHRNKNRPKSRKEESASVEYVTVNTNQEPEGVKFMFVYEDKEGVLFTKLDSIPKEEGDTAKIFPVYLHGHNTNLFEEEITFRDGNWTPSNPPEDPEATWLNITEDEILSFELSDVVVSNNLFFHCQDDLIDYIKEFGAEYLPVKN